MIESFIRAAQEKSVDPQIISVTQQTGGRVIEALELACQTGGWLILQNCENNEKLLKHVELTLNEGLSDTKKIHEDFRLILLVRSSDCLIGESLLSRSIKVRPRHNIKDTVLECYRRRFGLKVDQKFYNSSSTHES